ncbi:MAG: ferrous iron transport protein B [Phascolarctobacterium sp.]|nr:ferrous iron transport protein B [Phascolarctobacterium sp.]
MMSEIRIALVGNPNCGKTTMFNELTGYNQYVGNWPGVTVEKKEGWLKGRKDVIITDLPGIYSLSPYTLEEVVSRKYLLENDVDVILNIIDGSNIERNLYLTTQLLEIGIPVIIALNMIDVVRKNGDKIDIEKLAETLGCDIVETSALQGEGVRDVVEKAAESVQSHVNSSRMLKFASEVEEAFKIIADVMGSRVTGASERWLLIKLFERDREIYKALAVTDAEREKLEAAIIACEDVLGDDGESVIANERYNYIARLMDTSVVKGTEGMSSSDKIDRIVTNRYLALLIFVIVMFLVYYVSVTSLGTIVTDFTNDTLFGEWIQPVVEDFLTEEGTEEWMVSLVVDGIIGGLAAPIGFAPQMAILFLFLSFLEDCGYMARVAFIMDRIFHKFGLSGKSFIPLLISSGCGVPGIMSSRTIENEKDRRLTIMTTTFIPCGAKLPLVALISGAIMGGSWWMAPAMYFVGIIAVICSCIILKKTSPFAGDPAPFVMELPAYHIPSLKTILISTWERVWGFLKKAGTILFLCCVAMWFLSTCGIEDGALAMVETENSFMAVIGSAIAPLFTPIGFDSWQAVASAFSGFVAKEAIVSTMAILTGLAETGEEDADLWAAVMGIFPNIAAAFAFLVFNLLDSPCLASISTMSKEMNSVKWTWAAIIYQNVFAYVFTFMVYQFGRVLIGGEAFTILTGIAVIVLAIFIYLLVRPAPKKDSEGFVLSIDVK